MTQDSSNNYLYYKVAVLTYPGTGQSRLSLMVCNGLDYGTLGNAIDFVNATARTADTNSLSSGSPATFLQVRRLGSASSIAHFRYGMLNTGTALELWVRTSRYYTGVNFVKMALSGPTSYAIESSGSQTAVSTEPSGIAWATEMAVYDALNTTKASDGTLKAASPVARITCADTTTRLDVDEDGFEWCGYGVANEEARGIEIIREDVGVYRVTGAKSLASSGWRLLPPQDPDGSGELGIVKAEQKDNEIIIKLFRRKMVLENGEIVIQPGEPIDVPANSWIDVRLDMPESAIPPEPESHLEDEETLTQPE